MSYDLDLYFEQAVSRSRILQYFAARKRYTVEENNAVYQNPDTGVYFFIRLRCARSVLFQKNVVAAEFEINYHRPSFFGTEAEIELSAFVAAFQPRIHDPQIRGMGEGPYSGEGFLNGWNFGNVFSIRRGLSDSPGHNIPSVPADRFRAAWAWNYRLAERQRRNPDCFVPTIRFFCIDRPANTVVAWGDGMPVLHGAGHARDRPAGVPRDRLKQHRQRKHAADGDTAQQTPGRDDHPAIARIFHS
jgi:hypothetical protein